ncbi:uncharacterized protein LOC132268257 isoform X1 [Cornus florida]|uniref:uncharacterized protein LOC132268257 isoform X1 n=2 Tax=Cornus florida TaxID=4283 RepID=UPI0028A2695E|nr:uncharacterized protein LOC132268257 isoform X1 [Cornus florida]XP_059625063.1 uncharacterized protein LOC132268257 isoform X1 [Cornus florida]
MFIKIFIMNHSMRLPMFLENVKLTMLSIADTRFASMIVMLRRFKQIKRGLQDMVMSDFWTSYREDNVQRALTVKTKIVSDDWWRDIDYIFNFTEPIYDMLRRADTDVPCLHLVYEMWDSMIAKVKAAIYHHERKQEHEESPFFLVVREILSARWSKSNTPLHCLAHSLNPRFYSTQWLQEAPNRVPPHRDQEISSLREKCFQRYFTNDVERRKVKEEYACFSAGFREFGSVDSLNDRGLMEPAIWWVSYGASTPLIQSLALKVLGHPCSSSCCERNWSTYSFIQSLKRNKIAPQRAEDLVFVHSNLFLLSRRTPQYNVGETKMWDVGGDAFDSLEGSGKLEIANLSLDEPDLEAMIFTDEGDGNDDEFLEDPTQ